MEAGLASMGQHDGRWDEGSLSRDLADFTPESLVVCDADGRVRLWNAAAQTLYGFSADQAVGAHLHDLLGTRHPFGLASVEGELLEAGRWSGELFRKAADGRDLQVEVEWGVRRDASGALCGMLERGRDSVGEDVAGREAEITAHRYRNLFHAMAASFWELDFSEVRKRIGGLVQGGVKDLRRYFRENPGFIDECIAATVILDVNDMTVEMFGAPSRKVIMSLPLGWEWPPESRHVYAEALVAAFEKRDRFMTEVRLQRWDGTLMDALFTVCWPPEHKAQGSVLVGVIDISDMKAMERELRRSEVRYRNLFEFLPIAVWRMDGSAMKAKLTSLRESGEGSLLPYAAANPGFKVGDYLGVVEANSATADLFGLSKSTEAIGPLSRFFPNDDAALAITEQRMQGSKYVQSEARLRRVDGTEFDALVTVGFPDALADDSVNLVAAIDISDRVEAFRLLGESESLYRTLFNQMPIGLVQLDTSAQLAWYEELRRQGVEDLGAYFVDNFEAYDRVSRMVRVNSANHEAIRLLRAGSEQDLVGSIEPFWAEAPEGLRGAIGARFHGQASFSTETRIVRCDGTVMDVLFTMTISPELDARGISVIGFFDIGVQKEAAAALAESESRYRSLFEYMPMGICELDTSRQVERLRALRDSGVEILEHVRADPGNAVELAGMVTIRDANAAAVRMLEAESIEQLRGPVSEWWPGSAETLQRVIEARLAGDHSFQSETTAVTRKGNSLDALITIAFPPELDARGTSVVGFIDVGEQKRATQALLASERRFQELFEKMPLALFELEEEPVQRHLISLMSQGVQDLGAWLREDDEHVWEISDRHRIAAANAEAVRMFEADGLDDLLGPVTEFWRERPDTYRRSIEARIAGARGFSEETRLRTRTGRVFDALFTIAFAKRPSGEPINLVGVTDITRMRQAMNDLATSEGRYRDLFQQIPVGLWRLDPRSLTNMLSDLKLSGISDLAAYFDANPDFLTRCMEALSILEVNAAAARLAGTESNALVGMTIGDFWREHPGMFRNAMLARWRGERGYAEEGLMGTPANGVADVAFSVAFPRTDGADDVSVVSTIDIGPRKRAEERLRRAQADFSHAARVSTLGELAASIAHEVNQPLAAISAYAQASLRWLGRERLEIDELRTLSEQIVDDARRASDVIARIRAMAMKKDPSFVPLDLNELVEEALLIVTHEATSRSVVIEARLGPALPSAIGDRVQLQQVIVNLALNAAQAMDSAAADERVVTVATTLEDGMLVLTVSDTGPGIAEDAIDHLFTGFFTTKEHGMGMGLAICRSIVEAHGGFINSSNGAVGATFRLTLPPAVLG